jgi:hypothetical protein
MPEPDPLNFHSKGAGPGTQKMQKNQLSGLRADGDITTLLSCSVLELIFRVVTKRIGQLVPSKFANRLDIAVLLL